MCNDVFITLGHGTRIHLADEEHPKVIGEQWSGVEWWWAFRFFVLSAVSIRLPTTVCVLWCVPWCAVLIEFLIVIKYECHVFGCLADEAVCMWQLKSPETQMVSV